MPKRQDNEFFINEDGIELEFEQPKQTKNWLMKFQKRPYFLHVFLA